MLGYLREKIKKLESLTAKDEYKGLDTKWQIVVFAVAIPLIYSRNPSLFTHAQFYAEDGIRWYADAYNLGGLHSLIMSNVGYYVLLERLGAAISLLVPLSFAPLIMAFIGMIVQWLPIAILLSPRCCRLAPFIIRVLFAAAYLELPNAGEIHVVLTNAMWHLALAAVLLAVATSPKAWPGHLFDCIVITFAALSGPFCIFLTPVIFVFWWFRRQSWSLMILVISAVCTIAQLLSLAHYQGNRLVETLGATPQLFVRMIGGNVFTAAILGAHRFAVLLPFALLLVIFMGGVTICLYCLRHASLELRLVIVYGVAILLAGLRSPLASGQGSPWQVLAQAGGSRYWFFSSLVFVWASVWCALRASARPLRLAGTLALVFMPVGLVAGWRYKAFPDEHFEVYAQQVQKARPGQHVVIPIVPVPWTMELIKR